MCIGQKFFKNLFMWLNSSHVRGKCIQGSGWTDQPVWSHENYIKWLPRYRGWVNLSPVLAHLTPVSSSTSFAHIFHVRNFKEIVNLFKFLLSVEHKVRYTVGEKQPLTSIVSAMLSIQHSSERLETVRIFLFLDELSFQLVICVSSSTSLYPTIFKIFVTKIMNLLDWEKCKGHKQTI